MGLYDTVVIEGLKLKYPAEVSSYIKRLKAPFPSEFQTKDLDNSLSTFYIKPDNKIYREIYKETGKRVKREPLWLNWQDNRSLLERLYFKIKGGILFKKNKPSYTLPELKKSIIKSDLTSTFNIYSYDEVGGRYVDTEFCVIAVGGVVKKISLVKATIESEAHAKKRKADAAQFDQKMAASFEARRQFTSKWYYPILKEIYNPIVFFSKILIQNICNTIIKWTYRWHGV